MNVIRLSAGLRLFAGALATCLLMFDAGSGRAADGFPFDRELLLEAAPIRPAKRIPMLTVAEDGRATLGLWCRTVLARVQVSDSAIRIETAPLPEALPQYMSTGQCNEQRVQADVDMLDALSQVTDWRKRGDGVELRAPDGGRPIRFRASSH